MAGGGVWQDSSGLRLEDYPRPSVAVDVAVLTVPLPVQEDSAPHVLVIRREADYQPGLWSLPGTFLHESETLARSVRRCLADKAGVAGLTPRQLAVFDDPERDDRGWVLSVGHVQAVSWAQAERARAETVAFVPVRQRQADLPDGQARLPFDHDDIVRLAIDDLARRYADRPDPDHLLPEPYTVRDLRLLHQAIAGRALQKDTFRRQMASQLRPTDQVLMGSVGKPARLYRPARRSGG